MEIDGNVAVILQPDGAFVKQKAQSDWMVGEVVAVSQPQKTNAVWLKRLSLAAACLVLVLLAGLGGYTFFFETASVVSVDINPSVELELNRRGHVVNLTAYNDDGSVLLDGLDLKGKPYEEAIPALLQSDAMRPYLQDNAVLEFSVYSKTDEQELLTFLNGQREEISDIHPQLEVYCNGVGYEVVEQAHEYGVTPGKMRALLELQELDSSINIAEYSHHSMGEIRRLIREHHGKDSSAPQGGGQQGSGQGNGSRDGGSSQCNGNGIHGGEGVGNQGSGNGEGNGNGSGRHGGNGNAQGQGQNSSSQDEGNAHGYGQGKNK